MAAASETDRPLNNGLRDDNRADARAAETEPPAQLREARAVHAMATGERRPNLPDTRRHATPGTACIARGSLRRGGGRRRSPGAPKSRYNILRPGGVNHRNRNPKVPKQGSGVRRSHHDCRAGGVEETRWRVKPCATDRT